MSDDGESGPSTDGGGSQREPPADGGGERVLATDGGRESDGSSGPDPGDRDDVDPSYVEERGLSTGFLEEHGYLAWLGVRIDDAGDGWAVMRIPYDEKLLNPGTGGTVHGGVAATLIDTSSAFALRTTFEVPMEASMATTDLNVSYLRPARDDLVATAEVVRAGGSIGVADVTVESTTPEGEEKAVAVGRTTYRLFR